MRTLRHLPVHAAAALALTASLAGCLGNDAEGNDPEVNDPTVINPEATEDDR